MSFFKCLTILGLLKCHGVFAFSFGVQRTSRATEARTVRQPNLHKTADFVSSPRKLGHAQFVPRLGAQQYGDEMPINTDDNPSLYRLRLPRAPGIEWGTDLSFSFVYVRQLEPVGPADLSGQVKVGDQICELAPVNENGEAQAPIPLIGAPFDAVMNAFATLGNSVREVDLVFFHGTKEELIQACNESSGKDVTTSEDDNIIITVIERGNDKSSTDPIIISAKKGVNLRQVLTDNGINVYQSVTRWTNCKGKQLCGTCIVDIKDGAFNTNRKSMDEGSTLRENPEGYRLSCITFVYGDVTVETFPPVAASQWTR